MVAFVEIVLMANSKWKLNVVQKEIVKLKSENKDLKKYKEVCEKLLNKLSFKWKIMLTKLLSKIYTEPYLLKY